MSLFPVGFRQGQRLRPTNSKDTTRIATAHQHRNWERHTRHAWECLVGMGVSPGHLPCHTWGAHRMHLRSLWNCKVSQTVHERATYRYDDTRGCVIQFWPPDDEYIVLEKCRGMKQTYCKTKILCIKLVNYWDKYTEMHGQQNVKICNAKKKNSLCSITLFFLLKTCHLWNNVKKYGRAGQATDDNMAHAHCVLDN